MGKFTNKPVQFFACLLNWTWGFLQTVIGLIGFLCLIAKPHYRYKGSVVTVVKGRWGGVSLGAFIFIDSEITKEQAYVSDFVNHEYGHCLQSATLGPLYLLLIGLPSIIWAGCFAKWRQAHNKRYEWFFCERWADAWGGVKRV